MYEIIGIFNLKNLKQEFNTFFQTSIFLKYSIQQTSQYLMVEVMASFPDYALQLGSPNLHISWPVDSPQPVVLSDYSYLEDIGSICLSSDNVVIQICINNIIQSIHTQAYFMGWQGWRKPPLGRLSKAQPVMELMSAGRILIQCPDDFASHEPRERGRSEIWATKDSSF